mmetsp:Transcript_34783/g.86802  ORF Transcript_34783/g.86802 Transcript_34783/m.86802 type:complete len:288 (+) Transcript_34783:545-1408(+)
MCSTASCAISVSSASAKSARAEAGTARALERAVITIIRTSAFSAAPARLTRLATPRCSTSSTLASGRSTRLRTTKATDESFAAGHSAAARASARTAARSSALSCVLCADGTGPHTAAGSMAAARARSVGSARSRAARSPSVSEQPGTPAAAALRRLPIAVALACRLSSGRALSPSVRRTSSTGGGVGGCMGGSSCAGGGVGGGGAATPATPPPAGPPRGVMSSDRSTLGMRLPSGPPIEVSAGRTIAAIGEMSSNRMSSSACEVMSVGTRPPVMNCTISSAKWLQLC